MFKNKSGRLESTWPPAPVQFHELSEAGRKQFAREWTDRKHKSECDHQQCRSDDGHWDGCTVTEED